MSYGRLLTIGKHLQHLADQTIQIPKVLNNQASETDYDFNMQELNENDEEFMHRRLVDYLDKNPKVNESVNKSVNPKCQSKIVSPDNNLPSETSNLTFNQTILPYIDTPQYVPRNKSIHTSIKIPIKSELP